MSEHDHEQRAFLYLAGEMSPAEQEQYELLLVEDEAVRNDYLQTCRLLAALDSAGGSLQGPRSLPLREAEETSAPPARRHWFSATTLIVTASLLLTVGYWTSQSGKLISPDQAVVSSGPSQPNAQEIQRASAWFNLQEHPFQVADWEALLQENERPSLQQSDRPAALNSEEMDEGPLLSENEDFAVTLPDWLLTAVELKHLHSAPGTDPSGPAELSPKEAEESL